MDPVAKHCLLFSQLVLQRVVKPLQKVLPPRAFSAPRHSRFLANINWMCPYLLKIYKYSISHNVSFVVSEEWTFSLLFKSSAFRWSWLGWKFFKGPVVLNHKYSIQIPSNNVTLWPSISLESSGKVTQAEWTIPKHSSFSASPLWSLLQVWWHGHMLGGLHLAGHSSNPRMLYVQSPLLFSPSWRQQGKIERQINIILYICIYLWV